MRIPHPESLCWWPLMLATLGHIAALQPDDFAKGRDSQFADMQRAEQETILYLTDGTLSENEKRAQELDVMKSEYTLADLVLYHVKQHKAFHFLPPSQRKIFLVCPQRFIWSSSASSKDPQPPCPTLVVAMDAK